MVLIENASDTYADENKSWVYEHRSAIEKCGFAVDLVDLRNYLNDFSSLRAKLSNTDAVWLGGGNTWYLRWLLQATKADTLLVSLTHQGTVYGGGSAGAVVAGPTLKHFEEADDPKQAPAVLYNGLNLTTKVIVPHLDDEEYGPIMERAIANLQQDSFDVIGLTDAQAYAIDGNHEHLLE